MTLGIFPALAFAFARAPVTELVAPRMRAVAATALWLALGAVPALALSVIEAICRSGATVHVVAVRRPEADAPD